MFNLLRTACLFCHHFKLSRPEVRVTFFDWVDVCSDIQLGLQLAKYVAKLRLLEHGMLDAASALDNLHIRPKTKEQDDENEAETLEAFEKRVQAFVQLNLLRASGSRDNYKHGLVYQARKDLIQQILKASLLKRCQNTGCGA
jgi:DNA-directed RNA polymerase I subunit RPA1